MNTAQPTLNPARLRSTQVGAEGPPRAALRPFCGVVAAVVTPCCAPGVVDTQAMSRLCRILVDEGCDGLFIAASTGESVFLDEDDRRALFTAAREAMLESATLYAGVSSMGVKQSIRYAKNAAQDGANVAVAMAPFFLKISQPEVVEYLSAIADSSPIPVALYHHPRMTTPIAPETVARLAEHPNIVAMKDTSPDLERAEALIRATSTSNITILQGNESLALASLKLGAHGMVTALAGVVPEWHAALYAASASQNFESANGRQEQISKLWQMFRFEEVGQSISAFTAAIKLALRRRGWLERLDGMLGGFNPSDAFERLILEHLDRVGVPLGDGRVLRVDPPHNIGGEQGAVA